MPRPNTAQACLANEHRALRETPARAVLRGDESRLHLLSFAKKAAAFLGSPCAPRGLPLELHDRLLSVSSGPLARRSARASFSASASLDPFAASRSPSS